MPEPSPILLDVRDLEVEFRLPEQGVIHAVRGVSFSIPAGRTVALVGESGSGKSVIAQAVLGILPQNGRVRGGQLLFADPERRHEGPIDIARLDANGEPMRAIRGGRISMIFQEPMTSLSPLHTVGDQIVEAVLLHRRTNRLQARRLAAEMLHRVDFADPWRALDTYPFELSGGLRQRAMIAMALVCHPALLIADEPTTALDVTIQAQILKLIRDLQAELAMAVLLITHDLGVVANMADEVVVAYDGMLTERGSLGDIFEHPRHPYLRALMRAVPRVGMGNRERLTPIRDIRQAQGGYLSRADCPTSLTSHQGTLLRVRNVGKTFYTRRGAMWHRKGQLGITALDDVSIDIQRGECLGLVGESGCGKTTLGKIIMRAIDPDCGEITYNEDGRLLSLLDLADRELIAFRRKIQFVFQDPFGSLNPRMTVYDIISEPLAIHAIGDRARREAVVKELMAHCGLDPRFLSRYPHSFSGGQRQRISIARALALNPQLLICDEPVSALDVSVQAQILNLLKDLQSELGLTYLFISHNLAVVDYMADRIAVMCAGHLVEVAPRETLFARAVHPYTKALLTAVPRTDLDHRLDFAALMEGKVSDPAAWPEPFGAQGGERPAFLDLGDGHYVRAQPSYRTGIAQ